MTCEHCHQDDTLVICNNCEKAIKHNFNTLKNGHTCRDCLIDLGKGE